MKDTATAREMFIDAFRVRDFSEHLADWLRALANRIDPESHPIGTPSVDAEGKHLPRCTSCGIPRGTLRHGLRCSAGLCNDPDAKAKRVAIDARSLCGLCNHLTTAHYDGCRAGVVSKHGDFIPCLCGRTFRTFDVTDEREPAKGGAT